MFSGVRWVLWWTNLALVGDKAVFSRSLNDEHGLEVNGH